MAQRTFAVGAVLAARLLTATDAGAQDPADLPASASDPMTASTGIEMLQKRSYWALSARPRPFMSTMLEGGSLYFRPQLAIGYGRPHWSWFGVEGYATISPSGGAEYLGVRAAFPHFEVRAGARYAFSMSQYFLQPQATYTREDTELKHGPPSRYLAMEMEISGSTPLLGGSLFGVASSYATLNTPEGFYLYEEALHAVMKPPFLYRARLGFVGELDRYGEFRLGIAAEVLANPGRNSAVLRIGPLLSVALTHHLDVMGTIMVVAATPDTLGLLGADLGQLGLRYRWATGDRWPEFP